jgi:hypothetical protein
LTAIDKPPTHFLRGPGQRRIARALHRDDWIDARHLDLAVLGFPDDHVEGSSTPSLSSSLSASCAKPGLQAPRIRYFGMSCADLRFECGLHVDVSEQPESLCFEPLRDSAITFSNGPSTVFAM